MKCPRCGNHIWASEPGDIGREYADELCEDCQAEDDDRIAGAEHHYSLCEWDRGDDDEDSRCIGAECVNPHPFHTYSECETVEQHEAYEASLDEAER